MAFTGNISRSRTNEGRRHLTYAYEHFDRRVTCSAPRSMETRPKTNVLNTYVCPRCDTPDAEVLPIVEGAFCCCRSCRHLWVDERPMAMREPLVKRRRTDNQQ